MTCPACPWAEAMTVRTLTGEQRRHVLEAYVVRPLAWILGYMEDPSKLMFGTDCDDRVGQGPGCTGAQILAGIRRLSVNRKIERKILHENAKRVLKL